jgi:hypothetical protein
MAAVGGTSLDRVARYLRPPPERLDLVAAGAIALALAVAMVNLRFDGVWGRGVLLVVTLLACAVVLGPGMVAERDGEFPRPAHTALLVAGLALLAVAIYRLAQAFGVDAPLRASGTAFWTSALFAGIAAVPAWGRLNSPVCALIETLAGGVALLAFVDWVFEPHGPTTSRWILLLLIVLYAAATSRARPSRPRHAVQLVNAAGVAALALIFSFGLPFGAHPRAGTWWEIVILVVGLALVAYAILERHRGPGYLAFAVLVGFAVLAGQRDPEGASLIGWPLLLLLVGGGVLAFALRPARGALPPPPPPAPPPPAPPPPPPRPRDDAETRPLPPTGESPTEVRPPRPGEPPPP